MLNFKDARNLSYGLADLMKDLWLKREHLLSPDKTLVYMPYRVNLTDLTEVQHGHDLDANFYVHYLFSKHAWWVTISDQPPFVIENHNELLFMESEDDHQFTSYRHYGFQDCVIHMIFDKSQNLARDKGFKKITSCRIWDTFPFEDFRDGSLHFDE